MKRYILAFIVIMTFSCLAKDSYNAPLYEVKKVDNSAVQMQDSNIDSDLEYKIDDKKSGERSFASGDEDSEMNDETEKRNSDDLQYWKYDPVKY